MAYKLELIEHNNAYEKGKFLRLIDLLSVYEKEGFIKLILAAELDSLDNKDKLETPFHIVKAYNDQGALVGYSFYYPKEKTCEFYVLPHWRSKGIGTLLVNAMRENWSGTSVLCAYRGFDGWKNFFDRNFILEMDPFENGGSAAERNARRKSAKLVMSHQMAKAGIAA